MDYCIKCEKMVNTKSGHINYFGADAEPDEFDWCFGELGFASCPPPPVDKAYYNWLFAHEPDDTEMELINSNPELI